MDKGNYTAAFSGNDASKAKCTPVLSRKAAKDAKRSVQKIKHAAKRSDLSFASFAALGEIALRVTLLAKDSPPKAAVSLWIKNWMQKRDFEGKVSP